MNKSLMMFMIAGLMAAGVSSAMESEEDGPGDGDRAVASDHHGFRQDEKEHGPCGKLKLTDEQKAKIKDEGFKFKESEIDLRAQLEKARLKYRKIMASPGTDYKAAKAASQEVSESLSKLIAAKRDFKTRVAFQVLNPEQRGPAMACEWHRKGGFGHGKHRHHHGEDWG